MRHRVAPYLDELAKPRLRRSIVAFLDILGFSHISSATASPEDSQRLLEKIVVAIEDSRDFVRREMDGAAAGALGRGVVKYFSDNLTLGYPVEDDSGGLVAATRFIVGCAQRYQLRMALNGFFLRGAMVEGPICMTDEIIFGSALIRCYQFESKASIVPRVIVSEELYEALAGSPDGDAGEAICRDVDGWWFVNYLDAAQEPDGLNWDFIARHKRSILESQSRTTRHDVLPKFGWACRYHNVYCHWRRDDPGYRDEYRITRVDEQSTILRVRDVAGDRA